MPQSSVKSCKKIQVLLNDMSHEQSYKCIANRGRTISRTLLVRKPNRMVNPYRRVCRKTNQEVNTGGQREGRGMRGEEGKNRTQDSAHSEGDGRVVLSQKARGSKVRSRGAFRPVTGRHRSWAGRLSGEEQPYFVKNPPVIFKDQMQTVRKGDSSSLWMQLPSTVINSKTIAELLFTWALRQLFQNSNMVS